MKIAVTDACIFIDIYDIQVTAAFFGLAIEVHTSIDVFNELHANHRDILRAFQSDGKLTVHNILEEDRIKIHQQRYPNGLSSADKTVLYLAEKLDAMVISSDRTVRKHAKIRAIEYHGTLWILDELLSALLISHSDAAEKLKMLITRNMVYQNNAELLREMNIRLKKWEKQEEK